MERSSLIARKHEVKRKIEQTSAKLAQVRAQSVQVTGWFANRRHQRRVHSLETALNRLMTEEHNLRQAIDRSAH